MTGWAPIALTRDCVATIVPHGDAVVLNAGGLVQIVQRLGANITVRTEMGALLRINGDDADALGLEPDGGTVAHASPPGSFEMAGVIDALQQIYDPEIPVSIVELGLVYRCEEVERPEGGRRIEIDMSMTAPGCGMGDILRNDVIEAVGALPGVAEVDVTLVWDPPWSVQRMSEAARLQLGLL
ncbi:MAG: putative Fe-S cluster assembly protein SufT [Ilumatobacteraceae bacterium]